MTPETLRQTPELNTARVQSLLSQLGVNLSVKSRMVFPTDPKTGNTTWRKVVSEAMVSLSSSADVQAARELVAESLCPAPMRKIEHWLAELSAITARRGEGEVEAEISLSAYASRLATYPGDIVRDTLLNWWRDKWFPTWADLRDILESRASERRQMQTALAPTLAELTQQGA